jgi:hypothetical protein
MFLRSRKYVMYEWIGYIEGAIVTHHPVIAVFSIMERF